MTSTFLWSVFLLLLAFPPLCVFSYATWGKPGRIRDFMTLRIAGQKARDVLGSRTDQSEYSPEDQTVGEYLIQQYERAIKWTRFILPFCLYFSIYGFGIYFCVKYFGSFFASRGSATSFGTEIPTAAYLKNAVLFAALGFSGAVVTSLTQLAWRVMCRDLRPRFFVHLAIRLVVSPPIAVFLVAVLTLADTPNQIVAAMAFGFGLDPLGAFRYAQSWVFQKIQNRTRKVMPLRSIQGIGLATEFRLWEEGIASAQQLAYYDLLTLLVNTNIPIHLLIDWMDQALLFTYVGEDFKKWQQQFYIRGVLDALGCHNEYYTNYRDLCTSVAAGLGKDKPIVARLIDTIYQDPRISQLWNFYLQTSPDSETAQKIHDKQKI